MAKGSNIAIPSLFSRLSLSSTVVFHPLAMPLRAAEWRKSLYEYIEDVLKSPAR